MWETRYISPQVERILGYPPEEWLGDPWRWRSLIHPDDRARAAEADALHYGSGEPLDIELRILDQDGRERWLRDQAVVIRDDDGRPTFSQGIIQDITERKLAEEKLLDAEQRYRAIVEHIPAAIYLDRPDGSMETTYISPQILEIAGVTPEAWVADTDLWIARIVPEDRDEVVTTYARAVENGEPWQRGVPDPHAATVVRCGSTTRRRSCATRRGGRCSSRGCCSTSRSASSPSRRCVRASSASATPPSACEPWTR